MTVEVVAPIRDQDRKKKKPSESFDRWAHIESWFSTVSGDFSDRSTNDIQVQDVG